MIGRITRIGRRLLWPGGLAALALVAAPASGLAQDPLLRGRIVDSAGAPIEGAELELTGARQTATSGADGRFVFRDLNASRYWLSVRRVGFLPLRLSLTLKKDVPRDLELTMERLPFELPEVIVEAENERYERMMSQFLWRSRSTWGGRFLTRDDLSRFGEHPGTLGSIVLRHLPYKSSFVMDQPGGYPNYEMFSAFTTERLTRRTRYWRDCPPGVALNGGPIAVGMAVNDIRPEEVEALEVYREGARLPIEYTWNRRAECGLVVVWLRSYVAPQAEELD
ncbi:MAG: carboxypeptidase-like regulatory domain-containing protein [Gemmatimonadales bacterium]